MKKIGILRDLIENNEHLSEIEIPMLIKVSKEKVNEKTKENEKSASVKVGIKEQSFELGTKHTNGEKKSYTDQFSKTLDLLRKYL